MQIDIREVGGQGLDQDLVPDQGQDQGRVPGQEKDSGTERKEDPGADQGQDQGHGHSHLHPEVGEGRVGGEAGQGKIKKLFKNG
jgi:hypothetical protein